MDNDRVWLNIKYLRAECVPVDCGQPAPLENGQLIGERTTFGEVLRLVCSAGDYFYPVH